METQPSMDDIFLMKVHQIIDENIENENFTVENLAEKIGLSRSMLHRKLIKLTGNCASEHITHYRLIKAKELLEHDKSNVSETAYKVGYKSPSYFNKVFKKQFNISPGEVKKGIEIKSKYLNFNLLDTLTSTTSKHILKKRTLIIILLILPTIGLLTFWATNSTPDKSIAVLPLHNLTGSSDNDYIVDGIHDALIGELGQISSLRVISRTSTLRYKKNNMLLEEVANDLGVKLITEGSVIDSHDSIKILIQLIKVFPKEKHILAKTYHDATENILFIQNNIAEDIANTIKSQFTLKEKKQINEKQIINPETYKAYLRGMYHLNKGTQQSFQTGIQHLEEAIKKDPGDPFAYAGLALGYATMGHGQLSSEEAFNRALNTANKAIKLDPTLDEAHTALSLLHLYKNWNWSKAKSSFENAIKNNPNNAIAHAHFAWYHYLFNDMKLSLHHAQQATIIEPLSPSYHAWLGLLFCKNHQFDKAEKAARKALDLNDKAAYAHLVLGWCYIEQKQYLQAIEILERLPSKIQWDTHKVYCYVKSGQKDKALKIWNKYNETAKKQNFNSCYRGLLAAGLGFDDEAFKYLNEAIDKKTYPITYINYHPCTENIRDDIRYTLLLQRMNLPYRNSTHTTIH